MAQKQSKYSKRRPAVPVTTEPVMPTKLQELLDDYLGRHYQLGIFIDDVRTIEDTQQKRKMPTCDSWVTVRSYREYANWIEDNIFDNKENTIKTIFVSFDYQLDANETSRYQPPTGRDCLVHLIVESAEHEDIFFGVQGHSQDKEFNKDLIFAWHMEHQGEDGLEATQTNYV